MRRPALRIWITFVAAALISAGTAIAQTPGVPEIIPLSVLNQNPNDTLFVDIGGPFPGAGGHDQYQILPGGFANLDGRLDLNLINGFLPAQGDELTLITAPGIDGQFRSHFLPGDLLPSDTALEFIYGNTDFKIRFVQPSFGNDFVGNAALSDWFNELSWAAGQSPLLSDVILMENQGTGIDQTVVVDSLAGGPGSAVVHDLTVIGNASQSMALRVQGPGSVLSATQRVQIENNGHLQLLGGGQLVTHELFVNAGGTALLNQGHLITSENTAVIAGDLFANGLITGNVSVVGGGTVHPSAGASAGPGELLIQGNYTQSPGGTLFVDIFGSVPSEIDRLEVTGSVNLEGELNVDFSQIGSVTPGQLFEVISAGSLATGSRFDNVKLEGLLRFGAYAVPQYTQSSMVMLVAETGDMNFDGAFDATDVDLFVLALRDREAYFNFDLGGFPIGFSAEYTGDTDGNGYLGFGDIDEFISKFTGPAAEYAAVQLYGMAVPEPSSGLLLLLGGAGFFAPRRRAVGW